MAKTYIIPEGNPAYTSKLKELVKKQRGQERLNKQFFGFRSFVNLWGSIEIKESPLLPNNIVVAMDPAKGKDSTVLFKFEEGIGCWDVSYVSRMDQMFQKPPSFSAGDLVMGSTIENQEETPEEEGHFY